MGWPGVLRRLRALSTLPTLNKFQVRYQDGVSGALHRGGHRFGVSVESLIRVDKLPARVYIPEHQTALRRLTRHLQIKWTCKSEQNAPRAISTNLDSASGALFLSGWYFLLNRL